MKKPIVLVVLLTVIVAAPILLYSSASFARQSVGVAMLKVNVFNDTDYVRAMRESPIPDSQCSTVKSLQVKETLQTKSCNFAAAWRMCSKQ